jgi:electron transport complex protein RnfA
VYLPLITVNCAILFACVYVFNQIRGVAPGQQWRLGEAMTMAFFGGLGFLLAIIIMAGIREELDFADVPKPLRGPGITLIVAGILAMAFSGFARMDSSLKDILVPPPKEASIVTRATPEVPEESADGAAPLGQAGRN